MSKERITPAPTNHNEAANLARIFDRDYPTDERGIGNLGRAYLDLLATVPPLVRKAIIAA